MAPLTIGKKQVDDAALIEALEMVQESQSLKPLHDGDDNFTEQELGAVLDCAEPERRQIDAKDADCHASRQTGLTPDQLVLLAKAYRSHFPNGEKYVSSGIWRYAQIKPSAPPMNLEDYLARMESEITPRRNVFLRTLRLLHGLGVELKPQPIIPVIAENDIDWECTNEKSGRGDYSCLTHNDLRDALRDAAVKDRFFLPDNANISFLDKWDVGDLTPDKFLEAQAVPLLEAGHTFLKPGSEVTFVSASVHIMMDGDTYWISAWDWMEGKPFFVRNYPAGRMSADTQAAIATELREAILRCPSAWDPKRPLGKIAPLSEREQTEINAMQVYRLNHPAGWSEGDIENAVETWGDFSEDFEVKLEGRSFTAEIDRDRGKAGIVAPLQLSVTPKTVQLMEGRALEIHGFLESISLMTKDEAQGLQLGQDQRLRYDGKEILRDKYGNVIVPLYGFHFATGKPFFQGFKIYPHYPLARDTQSVPVRTVGVDLARFGFGDHRKLLAVQSLAPTHMPDQNNPYFLYSTLPADGPPSKDVYDKAARLAARTEELFGFRPGERVKEIFLVPSNSWNATVRFANPSSFFIWDELFADIREGRADFVVPHEVFHNFDVQSGFSLEPGFIGFFERLIEAADMELFDAIDEKNFFKTGKGGHSADNVLEFFATLTNSITAPEWNERVAEMTPRVRGLYYHALKVLRKTLLAKRPEISSAPVFKILEDRIRALESGAGTADGKKVSLPSFDKLVRIPTSKILQEGPNSVQVIKPRDFAREVLKTNEPVVLMFFSEGQEHDISFIRSVRAALDKGTKVVAMRFKGLSFPLDLFGGRIGTQMTFIFMRGKIRASVERGLSSPGDRGQRMIADTKKWVKYLEQFKPTPIPIIGPLIDLIRLPRD